MKQFISTVLAFLISVFGFFLTPSPAADLEPVAAREGTLTVTEEIFLTTLVDTELAWLASLQLENGALPMTKNNNGDVTVNPYFADITAMALLDKPQQYAQCVKAYLVWHFEHLNTKQSDPNNLDATIFDYTVTLENGKIVKETAKNSYDSVDSYAATFLTTLAKYYARTGDSEFIIAHADDINRVTKTMLSTMFLGLSMASPSYEIKYLMDNCEVYEGLTAVTALYEEVLAQHSSACEGMLRKCDLAFTQLCNAMENVMWDADDRHYAVALGRFGETAQEFSWDSFYPCATAQLFPILCGVIAPETQRANHLYDTFCNTYAWENFEIPSEFCWGANVLAAAKMNDIDRVMQYMENYLPLTVAHRYPLYNADIARVCMAAGLLLAK